MALRFENPPFPDSGVKGQGKTQRFVEELKRHPNKWAIYADRASSKTHTNRKKRFPGTEWRAKKIDVDEIGKPIYKIWARWVGEDSVDT